MVSRSAACAKLRSSTAARNNRRLTGSSRRATASVEGNDELCLRTSARSNYPGNVRLLHRGSARFRDR